MKNPWMLAIVLAISLAFAQTEQATLPEATVQQLNTLIDQYVQENNSPGVVVGVWIPGEGEYVKAFGTANLETSRAREVSDPFRIGSITKTFTATAILQLIEEGKLSKSDPLSNWYPDFPNADEISIDDLLRMRSGIADYWSNERIGEETTDKPYSVGPESSEPGRG